MLRSLNLTKNYLKLVPCLNLDALIGLLTYCNSNNKGSIEIKV